jgi:hypothetical protein
VPGSLVLGGLCLLLIFASARGEWVTFPLTAALRARDIFVAGPTHAGGTSLPLGLALQALVLAGAAGAVLSRRSSLILFASSAALVAALPIQVAFYRVSWLHGYLRQSTDRLWFGGYVSEHFVDNQSPEPAFIPITQFQDASDQLWLGFNMMGWGWYVSLLASVTLVILAVRGAKLRHGVALAGALFSVLSLVLVGPALYGLLVAERQLVRGDRFLVVGDAGQAIHAYESALSMNPALGESKPFLVKVSMAYNVASGGKHPLGLLAQDLSLTERQSTEGQEDLFDAARKRLVQRRTPDSYRATSLDEPLERAALQLESDLWRLQGIALAKERRFASALGCFSRASQEPDSLSTFFLAHAYLVQGSFSPAIDILQRLDALVAQKSIHADVVCTLGDAYTASGNLERGRDAYRRCRELDKLDNFRATKALTGS